MAATYKIHNGPSKLDLMLSLFDSSLSHPRSVTFQMTRDPYVERGHTIINGFPVEMEVHITEVGKEDGSGESWAFSGYASFKGQASKSVKGYFHTQHRSGNLKVLE